MKFNYKAIKPDQTITKGILEASNIGEAKEYLKNGGLLTISIEAENQNIPFADFFSKFTQGKFDTVLFTRQLSSMLASGLTLVQSLSILKEQSQTETMKEVVTSLLADVEEGKTFSESLAKFPRHFSAIYVSLIKSAEVSGLMDKILDRLANNLEKDAALKKTIFSALLYPAVIITLMVLVMAVVMIFVIPQLTALYSNLNISLPLTTQVVVAVSTFSINYWPIVLGGIILLIIAYNRWVATETGKLIRDEVVLKIPIFGEIIRLSILAEFTRTLGLMSGSGTLVVQSLVESADVAGNLVYKNAILDTSKKVEKGLSMGDVLSSYNIFPPILTQMVKIGEKTGKLDESLLKVSQYFENDVESKVKNLTTAMEPLIMIVLGIGVAFLILSIITPIYNLTSSIQ